MTAVCLLVLVAHGLRSSDTHGFVDTYLEVLFADEGRHGLSVVSKTWSGAVRLASTIEGERGLEECRSACDRSTKLLAVNCEERSRTYGATGVGVGAT